MKNDMPRQMFQQEENLLSLIVKRSRDQRCSLALRFLLVALIQLPFAPTCFAQESRTDAVNLRDHIYKGNNLMQRRDFEGAIAEYEEALLIDPSNSTAKDNIVLTHNNWGIDLFRQKKYEEAREQWNTALKLNPYDRNAKNNLNVLRVQLSKLGPSASSPPPSAAAEASKNGSAPESADTKSGGSILPKGSQTAKEDNTPVPNAVILGRPSGSGSSSPDASAATTNGASATTSGAGGGSSSGGVVILNSGGRKYSGDSQSNTNSNANNPYSSGSSSQPSKSSAAANNPYASSSSSSPAMPKENPYASSSSNSSVSASDSSRTTASSSSGSSSNGSSLGMANIEEKLAALESKVYGHPAKDAPILQRLERLERDTTARPSLGSISDRLQTLLKTYGL